jgi:general secretion pathway protein H
MPTSARGSKPSLRRSSRGFTLIELLVVLVIIALSAGIVSLALRDGSASRLEQDGARLAALLEMARAESRVTGSAVRWVPVAEAAGDATETGVQFRFVGMPPTQPMPTRWLDAAVTAQVLGQPFVALGPDAILPAQRIVLSLADQRLELATDGLSPFAVVVAKEANP